LCGSFDNHFAARLNLAGANLLPISGAADATDRRESATSREIPKTGIDLFTGRHVLQDVTDTSRRAHRNWVSGIELRIVEIEL
jgi:hypothetical protein